MFQIPISRFSHFREMGNFTGIEFPKNHFWEIWENGNLGKQETSICEVGTNQYNQLLH